MSLLIRNINTLVLAEDHARQEVRGADMATLPLLHQSWVLIEQGRIHSFGPMHTCPERAEQTIDATHRWVLPCWCDSHTHLVYAGTREDEFRHKIAGLSYEEIARRGGGILNSALRLQQTPEEQLLEQAQQRLHEVQQYGTGAIEIKSGYGLSLEAELKMLRVIRRLRDSTPMPIKATFLGAHAIPQAYQNRRHEYIQLLTQVLLPRIADEGLADYCDVFCDKGFFTVAETDTILSTAARYGIPPKLHANELDYSGGVQIAVQHRARSVDHLEYTGPDEIAALLNSDTMPTLLPSTAFFLRLPQYAPARQIIDAGLPVALATDYNPGSSPSGRMSFVLTLACLYMHMTPEEAINAATLNGAKAMDLQHIVGSIARGKLANLIITPPMHSIAYLPYAFGSDCADTVVIAGEVVKTGQAPTSRFLPSATALQ